MPADVITTLAGRMGNQLFQYAATLKVLQDTGGRTSRLLRSADTPEEGAGITRLLDVATHPPTAFDRVRWRELVATSHPHSRLLADVAIVAERLSPRVVVHQSTAFSPAVRVPHGRRAKLEGYFQHPTWFQDTWHLVADRILERSPAGFAAVDRPTRVGLHLRRTDYVALQWCLPVDYYVRALTALGITDCEIVAVTDDAAVLPVLAEAVRPMGCRLAPPQRLVGSDELNDFWNLAGCSVVIPANSSFSWWSAAVATRVSHDTRVAYPTPWLPNQWGPQPLPDLGLSGWLPLESGLPR